MGSRSVDKGTTERRRGSYSLSSPGHLGLGPVGSKPEKRAGSAQGLCEVPPLPGGAAHSLPLMGLQAQKKKRGGGPRIWCLKTIALFNYKSTTVPRISGPSGDPAGTQRAAILTFISGIVLPRMRLKQIISGGQLKCLGHNRRHAKCSPQGLAPESANFSPCARDPHLMRI